LSGDKFQILGLDIYDGSNTQLEIFKQNGGVTFPLLLNAGNLASAYNAKTDHYFIIDGEGKILYRSEYKWDPDSVTKVVNLAILNLPTGIEGKRNKKILLENKITAFPNPFNPITTLSYRLFPLSGTLPVSIEIFRQSGKRLTTLVNEKKKQGVYQVKWDASAYASGIYLIRYKAGSREFSRRVVLLK